MDGGANGDVVCIVPLWFGRRGCVEWVWVVGLVGVDVVWWGRKWAVLSCQYVGLVGWLWTYPQTAEYCLEYVQVDQTMQIFVVMPE